MGQAFPLTARSLHLSRFIPTVSGTGVSVAAEGDVVLASATVAEIRGLVHEYLVIELTGDTITSLGVQVQLMSAASVVASQYDRVSAWDLGTARTVATDLNTASWYPLVINPATTATATLQVTNLVTARHTLIRSDYFGATAASGTNLLQGHMSGSHRLATAYDGLRFTFSAAWSGSMSVFGR